MLVYVRPSNEALLRARVPGAQDQRGRTPISFIVRVPGAKKLSPGSSALLFFRQLDRPRPFPFGQLHFLKTTVRPLKLADLVHLDNKGVCFMSQAAEPIPARGSGFLHSPSIFDHGQFPFRRSSESDTVWQGVDVALLEKVVDSFTIRCRLFKKAVQQGRSE